MDEKEKETLLCSKYNRINRILAIYGVSPQDREDLLHEVFMNALRHLSQLRDTEKMEAWLWTITRNTLNHYWEEIRTSSKSKISIEGMDEKNQDIFYDAAYERFIPELSERFRHEELVQALRQLSRASLTLLRLHYYEGYKLKEIAQIIGETESSVKSRHQRAIARLRRILIKSQWAQEAETGDQRPPGLLTAELNPALL